MTKLSNGFMTSTDLMLQRPSKSTRAGGLEPPQGQEPKPATATIVAGLRRLAGSNAAACALFALLAGQDRSVRETNVNYLRVQIREVTGIDLSKAEALTLLRQIADTGAGDYITGNRYAQSRIRWEFKTISIGKCAVCKSGHLESWHRKARSGTGGKPKRSVNGTADTASGNRIVTEDSALTAKVLCVKVTLRDREDDLWLYADGRTFPSRIPPGHIRWVGERVNAHPDVVRVIEKKMLSPTDRTPDDQGMLKKDMASIQSALGVDPWSSKSKAKAPAAPCTEPESVNEDADSTPGDRIGDHSHARDGNVHVRCARGERSIEFDIPVTNILLPTIEAAIPSAMQALNADFHGQDDPLPPTPRFRAVV